MRTEQGAAGCQEAAQFCRLIVKVGGPGMRLMLHRPRFQYWESCLVRGPWQVGV